MQYVEDTVQISAQFYIALKNEKIHSSNSCTILHRPSQFNIVRADANTSILRWLRDIQLIGVLDKLEEGPILNVDLKEYCNDGA